MQRAERRAAQQGGRRVRTLMESDCLLARLIGKRLWVFWFVLEGGAQDYPGSRSSHKRLAGDCDRGRC